MEEVILRHDRFDSQWHSPPPLKKKLHLFSLFQPHILHFTPCFYGGFYYSHTHYPHFSPLFGIKKMRSNAGVEYFTFHHCEARDNGLSSYPISIPLSDGFLCPGIWIRACMCKSMLSLAASLRHLLCYCNASHSRAALNGNNQGPVTTLILGFGDGGGEWRLILCVCFLSNNVTSSLYSRTDDGIVVQSWTLMKTYKICRRSRGTWDFSQIIHTLSSCLILVPYCLYLANDSTFSPPFVIWKKLVSILL